MAAAGAAGSPTTPVAGPLSPQPVAMEVWPTFGFGFPPVRHRSHALPATPSRESSPREVHLCPSVSFLLPTLPAVWRCSLLRELTLSPPLSLAPSPGTPAAHATAALCPRRPKPERDPWMSATVGPGAGTPAAATVSPGAGEREAAPWDKGRKILRLGACAASVAGSVGCGAPGAGAGAGGEGCTMP